MSHYIAAAELPSTGEKLEISKVSRAQNLCLLVGVVGAIASLAIFLFGGGDKGSIRQSYAFSWLFGFEVCFTMTVGCLFWVLLHNASNSSWGVAIRRIPETMANNFLVLGVLGLPLILVPELRETVWGWISDLAYIKDKMPHTGVVSGMAEKVHSSGNHLLSIKYPYLQLIWEGALPGWILRYGIYFLALAFGAWKLLRYSVEQDSSGVIQKTFSARRFSCGWLPVMAVCSTFACVDWVMSLNYKWFSTMWGVNVFAASALSSIALLILIVGFLKSAGHLKIVTDEHFHIMGKLMLAFTIFWGYIAFSQYFLIWYANIPEETQFYMIRNTGGWWWLSVGLTFLHFLVPFLALLQRSVKKNMGVIMMIAAWVIGVHLLEVYWWIMPQRGPVLYGAPAGPGVRLMVDFLMDLLALATIAGLCGYFFFRRLAKYSIYPCSDPRLEESINLKN